MNFMRNKVTLTLAFFLLFVTVSSAKSPPEDYTTIDIVTPSWENVTNKDGSGLYFDILRKIYDPYDIELKFTIVPWRRAVDMVKNKQSDTMLGGYYVVSDEVKDLFPRYPIGREVLAALIKKGPATVWEGKKSVAHKNVVWIRGYNYHKYLDVSTNGMEIDREAQGWKMVESGRADAYFENINFLNRYIKNEKVDMGQYEIHIISERPLFARFSNTPKSRKLIEIYDSRMPELLEQDEIRRLFDKWGFPYPSFTPREGNDGVKVIE